MNRIGSMVVALSLVSGCVDPANKEVGADKLHRWLKKTVVRTHAIGKLLQEGRTRDWCMDENFLFFEEQKQLVAVLQEIRDLGKQVIYPVSTRNLMSRADKHLTTLESMLGIGR